ARGRADHLATAVHRGRRVALVPGVQSRQPLWNAALPQDRITRGRWTVVKDHRGEDVALVGYADDARGAGDRQAVGRRRREIVNTGAVPQHQARVVAIVAEPPDQTGVADRLRIAADLGERDSRPRAGEE